MDNPIKKGDKKETLNWPEPDFFCVSSNIINGKTPFSITPTSRKLGLDDGLMKTKKYDVRETCKGNSRKTSQPLKLTKSQLSLYSEGQCAIASEERSGNQVDCLFSALDSAFPTTLENWLIDEVETDKQDNDNNTARRNDEALEYLLASMSNVPAVTETIEHGSKKKSSLDKVYGLTEVKNMLKNVFIYRILYPQFFPGNIQWSRVLLYGPPGTGKSLLAKSVAEEINATLCKVSSADLLSHWHGETEKQIRALFEEARSSSGPVVLFFDEIDGLCRCRSGSESDLVRRIKTELLIQFENDDSNGQHNNQTYLVGATNCPWDIDPAFLRRFHKKIYVPLPEKTARIDILKQGFDDIKTELTADEWEEAGKLTEGYSGSDLANVVMSSCCERLVSMMNCHFWKSNGDFWTPAVPNSIYSVRIQFQDLPSHQVHFRSINFVDLKSGITKNPRTVSEEELLRFAEYAAKYA